MSQARSAVIIGSGFIGCEAAASLASRGLDVAVPSMEELPQTGRLGRAAAERIAGWLADADIRLHGDVKVTGIDDGRIVRTENGDFEADLILTAAGVEPRTELAEQAGLAVEDGRIVVDERMATAAPGVFAAGDVALAYNPAGLAGCGWSTGARPCGWARLPVPMPPELPTVGAGCRDSGPRSATEP